MNRCSGSCAISRQQARIPGTRPMGQPCVHAVQQGLISGCESGGLEFTNFPGTTITRLGGLQPTFSNILDKFQRQFGCIQLEHECFRALYLSLE